jgi:heat-inducible transcriptional repressor
MEERHAHVLEEIIEAYIRLARPVGSSYLADALSWNVSPATIRNIMHDLEEEGYIYQPHTSAGRIPTDRGYRYYVDNQRQRALTAAQAERIREGYEHMAEEYRNLNRTLAKLVAHLSHSMAVSYHEPLQDVQEAGFKQLLNQPESEQPEAVREVSTFLEDAEDYLVKLAPERTSAAIVIGEENSAFDAKHVSLVVRSMDVGSHGRVIIAIVGPKRMPYHRHFGLLEGIARLVEEGI